MIAQWKRASIYSLKVKNFFVTMSSDLESKIGEMCHLLAQQEALMTKVFDQALRTNLRLHDLKKRVETLDLEVRDLVYVCNKMMHCLGVGDDMVLRRDLKRKRKYEEPPTPVDVTENHPDYADSMDKSTKQLGSAWESSERMNLRWWCECSRKTQG